MAGSSNKDIVLRFIEEHFKPPEFAMELCTPDLTVHWNWADETAGAAQVATILEDYLKVFSDLCVEVEDCFAEGDKVAVRFRLFGTHSGEFRGAPPTGKKWSISEVLIFRLDNSRIAEAWVFIDELHRLEQLDFTVIPPGSPKLGVAQH
jgi:steroid delta-isomerase-like uncharacterized protein